MEFLENSLNATRAFYHYFFSWKLNWPPLIIAVASAFVEMMIGASHASQAGFGVIKITVVTFVTYAVHNSGFRHISGLTVGHMPTKSTWLTLGLIFFRKKFPWYKCLIQIGR